MEVSPATRRRLRTSATSAVVVLAIVPAIMLQWASTALVLAWTIAYVCGISLFAFARLRSNNPHIELAWTIVFSVLFGALPLSTLVGEVSGLPVYASAVIGIFHLANEVAIRGHLESGDWRIGPLIVASAVAATLVFHGELLLGVGCFAASLLVIHNAHGTRTQAVEIRFERDHDELTGLLSRRGLFDTVRSIDADEVTVAMIDADRFKMINDTYGYAAGDAALCAMAGALRERLGESWHIARQGGDEFVAVTSGRHQVHERIGEPLSCALPYRSSFITIDLRLSVGIAVGSAAHVELAMTHAAHALRASKRLGAGVSTFDAALERRFTRALAVTDAGSTDEESLFAVAQPICRADTLVGWELLARWRTADGEILSPATVLPLLAENGLTPQLNDRMLEVGVQFAARFSSLEDAPYVSVNITASHLANPALATFVSQLLRQHRVEPRRLMIEITESEELDAVAAWRPTARALVEMGVLLAIDDFGSGYSSIERMHQLPVTHLKFDRNLVTSLDGPLSEVVQGVVRFADRSGIGIIAEGIERADEHAAIESLGVSTFQGHLFGRPEPLEVAAREWTAARRAQLARRAQAHRRSLETAAGPVQNASIS